MKRVVRLHRADGTVVEWREVKDDEEAIQSVKTATLYKGETIEAFDTSGSLLDVRCAEPDALPLPLSMDRSATAEEVETG